MHIICMYVHVRIYMWYTWFYLCASAQLISCAYCRFLTYFCALSAIFPAHFLRFMIRARSLPAIATDINIFELISTSHICQLSAIRYLLSARRGQGLEGKRLCCCLMKWHVSLLRVPLRLDTSVYKFRSHLFLGACC